MCLLGRGRMPYHYACAARRVVDYMNLEESKMRPPAEPMSPPSDRVATAGPLL